jgi:acetyl esterase
MRLTSAHRLAFNVRNAYSDYLWNRNPPHVGAFHGDAAYVVGGGRKQRLDIVSPGSSGPYPVMCYLHGGGWHFGDKNSPTRVCKCFAHEGILVFNINYRLAPRYHLREQLRDVADAVGWARDNAPAYGGDPDRIVLAGESAGAHLASTYAAAVVDEGLSDALSLGRGVPPGCLHGLLLFYGVYDLESALRSRSGFLRAAVGGLLADGPARLVDDARLGSPLMHVSPRFPPVYICSSEQDDIHPQSREFAAALRSAGVPCTERFFRTGADPDAPHGFLAVYPLESSRIAMRDALLFVRDVARMGPDA